MTENEKLAQELAGSINLEFVNNKAEVDGNTVKISQHQGYNWHPTMRVTVENNDINVMFYSGIDQPIFIESNAQLGDMVAVLNHIYSFTSKNIIKR